MSEEADEFLLRLKGFRLTTAEILYRLPDHRSLVQLFLWQEIDLAPRFPRVRKFLGWWEQHLDGPLVKVRVTQSNEGFRPIGFRVIKPGAEFVLH
jgi:uncharacterized protein Usg